MYITHFGNLTTSRFLQLAFLLAILRLLFTAKFTFGIIRGDISCKFSAKQSGLDDLHFGHGHVVPDLQQGRNERDEGLLQRFGTFLFFSIAIMLSFCSASLQCCHAAIQGFCF